MDQAERARRPAHWTPDAIEICERDGHDLTIGLRHDLARMAMVADCQRCGAVLMLDQTPVQQRRQHG